MEPARELTQPFAEDSMRRSSVAVALLALGQLSCGGSSQPTAPTNSLSLRGVVTLGDVVPSVQLSLASGGNDVSSAATWQSSTPTVATVSPGGLVRAAGLGTTTISAVYQGQTASAMMSVAPDQDCIPYDPTNVGTLASPSDPTIALVTAPVPPIGSAVFSAAATPSDAANLVALYRQYSRVCYIGRNFGPQYVVTYFKNPSGQQTTIAPEDCVSYSAAALQVANQGAAGWALMSGGTELALLENAFEAALASNVASQATNECFIGRGNTRPNPHDFVTEYWK